MKPKYYLIEDRWKSNTLLIIEDEICEWESTNITWIFEQALAAHAVDETTQSKCNTIALRPVDW